LLLPGDRRLEQVQGSIDLGQFALVLGTLVRTEVSLFQTIYQLPFLREQLGNDHRRCSTRARGESRFADRRSMASRSRIELAEILLSIPAFPAHALGC